MMNIFEKNLIEKLAQEIYTDSYTQYGNCSPERWKKTSESQRDFHRNQAAAVVRFLKENGLIKI